MSTLSSRCCFLFSYTNLLKCRSLRSAFNVRTCSSNHLPETSLPVYQDSFGSFDQMMSSEKSAMKEFILLEDISRKLINTDPEVMSKVIDWPVEVVYRVNVPKEHVFLLKLKDYANFIKKCKPSHLSGSLPITSRMLQVANVSHVREATVNNLSARQMSVDYQSSRGQSLEAELKHLSQSIALTECGSKIRFFIVNQLEELLCTGIFSNFTILPFGSSVNGFGSDASDLDMTFDSTITSKTSKSKLKFCCKELLSSRELSKRFVNSFSDTINWYVPGFRGVTAIPRARVPIIRMYSRYSGLDCDISFQSPHSVEMARILFSLNKSEPKLRQLVLFCKIWLSKVFVDPYLMPGYFVSNFMMTIMIISFLQTYREGPLLPPIKHLGTKSEQLTDKPVVSSSVLLEELFKFLASFDYQRYGMSILNSKIMAKSTHSPLYIENPCDVEHNISRNITLGELRKFIDMAKKAADIISQRPDSIDSLLHQCGEISKSNENPVLKQPTKFVNINEFWN